MVLKTYDFVFLPQLLMCCATLGEWLPSLVPHFPTCEWGLGVGTYTLLGSLSALRSVLLSSVIHASDHQGRDA